MLLLFFPIINFNNFFKHTVCSDHSHSGHHKYVLGYDGNILTEKELMPEHIQYKYHIN